MTFTIQGINPIKLIVKLQKKRLPNFKYTIVQEALQIIPDTFFGTFLIPSHPTPFVIYYFLKYLILRLTCVEICDEQMKN
jgi:hypothetical protein